MRFLIVFGDNDAVVDEKTERDDDGRNRNTMQRDIPQQHADQSKKDAERHNRSYDGAGSDPKKQHHDSQNCDERLPEIAGRFRDRGLRRWGADP